jgi:peptidoglycan/xylan/chitin deacetylase (PgdA/CDA1 family)
MTVALPILTFHALDDKRSPLSFPPELFQRGMRQLHQAGFRTVSATRAASLLREGKPLPGRLMAITFDDGYRSVFEHGLPVLEQLGYTATVFLNTGPAAAVLPPMEGRDRLSWGQIQRLHEAGIEIGAHSVTHPDLTALDEIRIEAEVAGSRAAISEAIGAKVSSFAYPFGRHSHLARSIVRGHFECAFTTELGVADSDDDTHALPRLEMHYFRNEATFSLLSSAWLKPYVFARGIPRALARN